MHFDTSIEMLGFGELSKANRRFLSDSVPEGLAALCSKDRTRFIVKPAQKTAFQQCGCRGSSPESFNLRLIFLCIVKE